MLLDTRNFNRKLLWNAVVGNESNSSVGGMFNQSIGNNTTSADPYAVSPTLFVIFILGSLLALVGLAGNLLVCWVVFKRKRMHTVANMFLMNLAVADVLVLIINCPLWIIRETTAWPFGSAACVVLPAVSDSFYGVSLGCITMIALHRYRMIMWPMKKQLLITHVIYIVISIWVVSLATISAPIFTILNYKADTKQCLSLWPSKSAFVAYQLVMFIVWYIFPLAVISITYFHIRVHLQHQMNPNWLGSPVTSRYRVVKSNGSHSDPMDSRVLGIQRALKLLAPVVIAFFMLMLPWNVLRVVAVATSISNVPHIEHVMHFSATLLIANSAVNPFIYYFVSREFRKEFRKFLPIKSFCPRPPGAEERLGIESQTSLLTKREGMSRILGLDILGRLRGVTRESTL